MTNPYDVPIYELIQKTAEYLKGNDVITPPIWADFVKTGSHVQRRPQNPDWWYIRCASILRKVYVHGPIGLEKSRAEYGGRKDYGSKPEHAVKAGGSIIRKCLQQLEKAGLIEIKMFSGRKITGEGRKLLKELAEEVQKERKEK